MLTLLTPSTRHLIRPMDLLVTFTSFSDGAYNIEIPAEVQDCVVRLIHNTRTHDDWILLYLLIDQLLQRRCQIDLILPYVSYGRQSPDYLATLLRPLKNPSIFRIVTVDLHQDREGIMTVSMAPLIAKDIQDRGLGHALLVAPDKGAAQRVIRVAHLTGQPVIGLTKVRSFGQVVVLGAEGGGRVVGKDVIIIDDMVDTGATLMACADYLLDQGVSSVHVMATHGLLSQGVDAWAHQFASLTFLNTLPPLTNNKSIRWLDSRESLNKLGAVSPSNHVKLIGSL
jgi:ribose-phosphate pyrophosphokinase